MTACDQVQAMLSALIDSELSNEDTKFCRSHLHICEVCQREWESLQEVDGQLKQFLVLSEVDIRSVAISQRGQGQLPATAQTTAVWTLANWLPVLVAIAAVLLLAMMPFFWNDDSRQRVQIYQDTEVARLVRSTGPVQVLAPGESNWTKVAANANFTLVAGSRLRTLDVAVCQLETPSKGIIRLNTSAELILRDPNRFELVSGQLWCLTPDDCQIEVDVAMSDVPPNMLATLACPSGSEIQCEAGRARASYDSVSAANALASVTVGGFSCEVAPGELVSVDAENRVNRTTGGAPATRLWQLPLLANHGSVTQELVSLLNSVLAPIGRSKAMHLNELQIRQLGPPAAIPLLAYATMDSSSGDLELRRTAMRLAADIADENALALLEPLLNDPDVYISQLAKTTQTRLHQGK